MNFPPGGINENMCAGRMDGIIFPDLERCDAFLQCQRGVVTRQTCQAGTSFDLNLYYCVPHQIVNCGQRKQQILPPSVGEVPPSSESHHSVSRDKKKLK